MARVMQVGCGVPDDVSSVSSKEGSSFKKGTRPLVIAQPSYVEPETLEFDDDNLHFSDIPVMSNDGMYDDSDRFKNNDLQEDE